MQRGWMKYLAVCGGIASGGLAALAQTPPTATIPPAYRGVQTRVGGVYVTPIPNAPLTATVDISSTRILPDGSTEMRKSENHIARDSRGRIYNEMRRMVVVGFTGVPPLSSSHVYDPATRISTTWSPYSNVAQSITLNAAQSSERKPFSAAEPNSTDVDLGESSMSGFSAHGLRRTRTVEAVEGGTRKSIQITDEYWYSEDLHLILLERHSDTRTGEQIVTILNISRAEPDEQIFSPPKNYRVVDLTPDQRAPAPQPTVP